MVIALVLTGTVTTIIVIRHYLVIHCITYVYVLTLLNLILIYDLS